MLVCGGRIGYIGAPMVGGDKTRRHIAAKIALPGILVISLLVARAVVGLRSAIRLSAPLELSYSGLSVSMPSGNGWQFEGRWIYDGDGFTLSSIFTVGGRTSQGYTHCRYLLAPEKGTLQERFSRNRGLTGGEPVETGRMQVGQLVVDWARMTGQPGQPTHGAFEVIFGVCELKGGRQLEIEVFQTADEPGLTKRVFDKIVAGINVEDNGLLQSGEQIVGQVRAAGLSGVIPSDGEQVIYSLADARGRTIGFTMDALKAGETDGKSMVTAASYQYVRGPIPDEQVGFFRGKSAFDEFVWRVESSSRAGSRGVEMVAEANVLEVRLAAGGRVTKEKKEYVLGDAMVPDIVTEPILKRILGDERQAVVIDVIRPDGTITPVHISKIKPADGPEDGYVLRVELLDGRGYWQEIHYDGSKEPRSIVLWQEGKYTLERTTAEQIDKTFPERAYLVRDQSRLLEPEGQGP